MRIGDISFSAKQGRVEISDDSTLYKVGCFQEEPPVCNQSEDYFSLVESGGESLIIERLNIRHEAVTVRMIIDAVSMQATKVIEFPATILQKQKGNRQNGIIVEHPLLNGLICREAESRTWQVYRPFQEYNCGRTKFKDQVNSKAFRSKYLGVSYAIPKVELCKKDFDTILQQKKCFLVAGGGIEPPTSGL